MKYSLRSLMLLVTVVAVLTGLWVENWRICRSREREHAEQASQLEKQVKVNSFAVRYTGFHIRFPDPGLVPELQQQALYHRSLEAEYRQAIWQPWKRLWIDEARPAAANANVNSN
jgi:hypothetical protein